MADNRDLAALTGNAACDEVTYSGDTAVVQLMRLVDVTGSEGSKTVVALPVDATAGLKVNLGADNDVTVTSGTVTTVSTVTAVTTLGTITNVVHVDDNSGSLTVDNAALSVTGGGVEATALRVTLASDSTGVLSIDDNGGAITVDGTVAATQSGTWNVGTVTTVTAVTSITNTVTVAGTGTFAAQITGDALTALQLIDDVVLAEDAAHTTGDKGVMALAVRSNSAASKADADGDYQPLITDTSGKLWVNAGTVPASQSGSWSVTVTSALIGGDIAHDSADSGLPVKIGAKATVGATPPSVVIDGDRTNAVSDASGRIVVTGAPRDQTAHTTTTITASTSETTVLAAAAANVYHDIVGVIVVNSSATAARVEFKDATAGTTRFHIYAPAGATVGFMPPVPVAQATAAANWTATSSASVSSLHIFVQAIKTKG